MDFNTFDGALSPGYWIDERMNGAWRTLPWPSGPDERRYIADNSLGPQIIAWAEGRTDEPGLIHHMTGKPWRFTQGQKQFIMLWWQVDPETGMFVYRSGLMRGSKGTGKDVVAAAFLNCDLLGPVEIASYGVGKRPVGRRRQFPLAQVLSNSEAQSQDVLRVANGMFSQEARRYYNLDCGITRTQVKGSGARIEIVTSSVRSAEGDVPTSLILNESHHLNPGNGGTAIADVARRNVAKSADFIQARVLELTNAHRPGEDSVAEGTLNAWLAQQDPNYRGRRDILYSSMEASPYTDLTTPEGIMEGLKQAYADAPWAPLDRLVDEVYDARTSVATTMRFYLNCLMVEEDAWVDPGCFDALSAPREIERRDPVALFLDCSKSGDATALVACTLWKPYIHTVGVWERPKALPSKFPWRVPRESVESTIDDFMRNHNVVWFGIDPSPAKMDVMKTGGDAAKPDADLDSDALYWQPTIDRLLTRYGRKMKVAASYGRGNEIMFDMRLSTPGAAGRLYQFTKTAELFQKYVDEEGINGQLRHDGHPALLRHVHNAKGKPNKWGTSLGKVTRDSKKHVDLAVAAVGALLGARMAEASGRVRPPREMRSRNAAE